MKLRIAAGLLLVMTPLASAAAMPVSTFLAKAERLERKGALAMFSADLKLLMKQIKADLGEIRSERLAAKAAGRPTAFCPPEAGAKLTDQDILTAMRSVPASQRASTSTRQAMSNLLIRRYPCP